MMKKALAAMVLTGIAMSAQANIAITQDFDKVSTLEAQGWVFNNASSPVGPHGWYQGDQLILTGQAGAANAYIASNWDSALGGGMIDNWLITPIFNANDNVTVKFWLRADPLDGYADQIAYGFSDGSSAIDKFVMNTAFTVGTNGWVEYTATLNDMGPGKTARFAIEYTGAADTSNYVGVDTLSVDVPEPTSALLLAAGALGLYSVRRRQRG